MSVWPASLPQSPLVEGFNDTPQDSVIRSNMTGLTKQRNRYTAVLHDVKEGYWMTPTQFNTFETFYKTTLGNGAAAFTKTDPRTNVTRSYRFTGNGYTFEYNGIDYKVMLTLEKMP